MAGGDYLLRQSDRMVVLTIFITLSNEISNDYNILRHAGTTYSLLSCEAGKKKIFYMRPTGTSIFSAPFKALWGSQ